MHRQQNIKSGTKKLGRIEKRWTEYTGRNSDWDDRQEWMSRGLWWWWWE